MTGGVVRRDGLREEVARVLIGHQAAWVDDPEARVGYYGFYECGCNEHGHLNGLLLTQDDVARHQAAEVARVLDAVPDVPPTEEGAKAVSGFLPTPEPIADAMRRASGFVPYTLAADAPPVVPPDPPAAEVSDTQRVQDALYALAESPEKCHSDPCPVCDLAVAAQLLLSRLVAAADVRARAHAEARGVIEDAISDERLSYGNQGDYSLEDAMTALRAALRALVGDETPGTGEHT